MTEVLEQEKLSHIEALQRELDEAENSLRALRLEASGLRSAMGEAARLMDAERLTQLRRRSDEMPALIFVAEATAKRKRLAVFAAQRKELEAQLGEAMKKVERAKLAWQEAADKATELRGNHGYEATQAAIIESQLETNREEARDTEEELESLIELQSEVK